MQNRSMSVDVNSLGGWMGGWLVVGLSTSCKLVHNLSHKSHASRRGVFWQRVVRELKTEIVPIDGVVTGARHAGNAEEVVR